MNEEQLGCIIRFHKGNARALDKTNIEAVKIIEQIHEIFIGKTDRSLKIMEVSYKEARKISSFLPYKTRMIVVTLWIISI